MESTQRRGPLQFVYDILKNAGEPKTKTNLTYAANMNSQHLQKYLPLFLERGLVEEVPYVTERGRRINKRIPYLYVITEEGKDLIKLFEQIYEILVWGDKKPEEKPRRPPPPIPAVEQEYVDPCIYGLDFPLQDLETCIDCEHYEKEECTWTGWKKIGWEDEIEEEPEGE